MFIGIGHGGLLLRLSAFYQGGFKTRPYGFADFYAVENVIGLFQQNVFELFHQRFVELINPRYDFLQLLSS